MTPLKTALALSVITGCCLVSRPNAIAQDVDSVRPVVIKTSPVAGSKDVAAGTTEIKVTFSKEMTDGSWSWSSAWNNSTPEGNEKPHYEADKKTCVLKVKLEPGKTYGFWINSDKFTNFRDKQGRAAVPYLLVFKTKS